MTNEELLNQLDSTNPLMKGANYEALKDYILSLRRCVESAEKYKWHDLRKDPEDLPEVNPINTYENDVLLVVEYAGHPEKGRNIYKGHLKDRVEKLIKNTSGTDNFWGMPTYDVNWTIWGWSYFNAPKVIAWREIEPFADDYIMPENSDHRKQRGRTAPNEEER